MKYGVVFPQTESKGCSADHCFGECMKEMGLPRLAVS